jgi:hypothetical protein
VGENIREHIK